jgi:hypothetical protein
MNDELWHVQLGNGEVRVMTLEQLDASYQSGLIDERTFVLRNGSPNWTTLGDVAGIEEEAPSSVAPFATEIAQSEFSVPQTPVPNFDDLEDDVLAFDGRQRRGARRSFFLVASLVLVALGSGYAVKRYAPVILARTSTATASMAVTPKFAEPAPPPPPQAPPPAAEAPKGPATPAGVSTAIAGRGLSLDGRPDPNAPQPVVTPAPSTKSDKKHDAKKDKGKAQSSGKRGKKSNDPTQRGSDDRFDPMNGNL